MDELRAEMDEIIDRLESFNDFKNPKIVAQAVARDVSKLPHDGDYGYECGKCRKILERAWVFCPACGQKINWRRVKDGDGQAKGDNTGDDEGNGGR